MWIPRLYSEQEPDTRLGEEVVIHLHGRERVLLWRGCSLGCKIEYNKRSLKNSNLWRVQSAWAYSRLYSGGGTVEI